MDRSTHNPIENAVVTDPLHSTASTTARAKRSRYTPQLAHERRELVGEADGERLAAAEDLDVLLPRPSALNQDAPRRGRRLGNQIQIRLHLQTSPGNGENTARIKKTDDARDRHGAGKTLQCHTCMIWHFFLASRSMRAGPSLLLTAPTTTTCKAYTCAMYRRATATAATALPPASLTRLVYLFIPNKK
jgi:hypothetical protein